MNRISRTRSLIVMAVTAVSLLAAAVPAKAEAPTPGPVSPMYAEGTPIRKFERGLANAFGGWLEIPVTMSNVGTEEGPMAGLTVGLLNGAGRTIARTLIGVIEVVTFPVPFEKVGYGPIIEPEFLFHP